MMSAGIRSGVNWILENDSSSPSARVLISRVLPSPGTPSRRTWPPANIPISTWLMISRCPTMTFSTSARSTSNEATKSCTRASWVIATPLLRRRRREQRIRSGGSFRSHYKPRESRGHRARQRLVLRTGRLQATRQPCGNSLRGLALTSSAQAAGTCRTNGQRHEAPQPAVFRPMRPARAGDTLPRSRRARARADTSIRPARGPPHRGGHATPDRAPAAPPARRARRCPRTAVR